MSSYSDLILAHGSLRVYYRLGEGSGTTADDIGPNNIDGTYAASGVTYGVTGAIVNDSDTAVTFDGSAGNMIRADNNALDLADTLSIEVWVKRSATQSVEQGLVQKGGNAYRLNFSSGNTVQFQKQNIGVVATSSTTITDQNWHHIVATKNGTTRKIYIDAVDVTSLGTNQTFADGAGQLTVGGLAGTFFPGSLDELSLYSVALSADEVLQRYRTGKKVISLTDSVSPTEAKVSAPGAIKADSVTASDAAAKATGLVKTDSVTLTDAQAATAGLGLTDLATLSDTQIAAGNVTLGDTVTLSDLLTSDLAEQLTASLSDSVTLSDAIATSLGGGVEIHHGGGWVFPRKLPRRFELALIDLLFLSDHYETKVELDPDRRQEEELFALLS